MTRLATRAACILAATLTLASCSESPTAPADRTTAQLNLLHVTYDFPALATTQVSFWAVKGKPAGADLWYHARAGAVDSVKFVEFRMGADALDRRPDGSAIATGDSVLITLTATDARHMMIQFQPSGLRFSSSARPSLRIFWTGCGDDLNYDGKVDSLDDALAGTLGIWRQESADLPWSHIASGVVKTSREVDALLDGFTGYAISY